MAKIAENKRRIVELEAEVRRLRTEVARLKRGATSPAAEGEPRPPRGKRTAQ